MYTIPLLVFCIRFWVLCIFRKNSQYCYKHLSTGEVRWEYPDGGGASGGGGDGGGGDGALKTTTTSADDAMDICTTPPPNVGEQLEMLKKSSHVLIGNMLLRICIFECNNFNFF